MTNNDREGYWIGDDGNLVVPDPINLYCYAGNDPTNYIDPSGAVAQTVVPAPRVLALKGPGNPAAPSTGEQDPQRKQKPKTNQQAGESTNSNQISPGDLEIAIQEGQLQSNYEEAQGFQDEMDDANNKIKTALACFQHFAPFFYDRRAFFPWFLGVAQPRRKT